MVLDDIKGLENVFNLSCETGVKKIFYSSSSEVYGEPVEIPQNEIMTPLNARLPYAVVKNIGECFCKAYKRERGLDFTIFRFFNTYGEKQSSDFVVSKFLKAAISGEEITINGDGLQTRTFCYIEDNLEATVNAFENNLFNNEIVNIKGWKSIGNKLDSKLRMSGFEFKTIDEESNNLENETQSKPEVKQSDQNLTLF